MNWPQIISIKPSNLLINPSINSLVSEYITYLIEFPNNAGTTNADAGVGIGMLTGNPVLSAN